MADTSHISLPSRRGSWASVWNHVRHGLQFRVSLIAVLLAMIAVGAGSTLSLHALGLAMFEGQFDLARQFASSLAASEADNVAAADRPDSRKALDRASQRLVGWRNVACVGFADATGTLLSVAEIRAGLLDRLLPPGRKTLDVTGLASSRPVRCFGMTLIPVVSPVYAGPGRDEALADNSIAGYVLLVTDATATQARFDRAGRWVLLADLAILFLVIPVTILITRYFVAPLNELARTARALANGAMDARVPVRSRNEIGQLGRSFNLMANRITQSQVELLQLAAELEQRVEERTRELEDLAAKDALTGLYNRRYFTEVIVREFAAAERYGLELTCLMFDLDHFKQVNDRFGHRQGDEVLIAFARSIASELRTADIAARFGGDEFILLLPQTSTAAARSLADRVVRAFMGRASQQFPGTPVSLSVGIASLADTRAASAEALINQADNALYAAKSRGRNCVVEAASH